MDAKLVFGIEIKGTDTEALWYRELKYNENDQPRRSDLQVAT